MHAAFTRHPESVGESYSAHMQVAWSFSWRLLCASLACFVHGLLPFLFERTGSRAISELHTRMVIHRRQSPVTVDAPLAGPATE
jgi:hypothetical protein